MIERIPTSIVLLGLLGLVLVLTALILMVLRHRRHRGVLRWKRNPHAGYEHQWEVQTPAGRAVVQPVWTDNKGEQYEIEVYLDGMRDPVIHYVSPHIKVVERKLLALVDEWRVRRAIAERPRTSKRRP